MSTSYLHLKIEGEKKVQPLCVPSLRPRCPVRVGRKLHPTHVLRESFEGVVWNRSHSRRIDGSPKDVEDGETTFLGEILCFREIFSDSTPISVPE